MFASTILEHMNFVTDSCEGLETAQMLMNCLLSVRCHFVSTFLVESLTADSKQNTCAKESIGIKAGTGGNDSGTSRPITNSAHDKLGHQI